MNQKIEMQDSKIEFIQIFGTDMVIYFKFSITNLKTEFGIGIERLPRRTGKIFLKNVKYSNIPQTDKVLDGTISVGDFQYGKEMPTNLELNQPCHLHIEQTSGNYVVSADSIQLSLDSLAA